ncbi:hypothetical protein KP509_29G074700 [Ceratopteris richardii]|uniref:Germin-like protein n=1 Tax=Ceratopteris richardii TaxID=49495 RepID=A0A8T2R952_CERRI|nr:hypothetical protein KP509_29G074700 [Ceratopteris richardii]
MAESESLMIFGFILGFLVCTAQFLMAAEAADADPLQDFCIADNGSQITINGFPCIPMSDVDASAFATSLLRQPRNDNPVQGSAVNLANAITFPALNTEGLSVARIDYRPRGLNPPHLHPLGTEVLFVAHGTLLVGFVSTSKRFYTQVLKEGDLFVFPRALPHFQFNVDQRLPALAISSFNSQNPGVVRIVPSLLAAQPPLPTEVLQIALGIRDQQELARLIANAPTQ